MKTEKSENEERNDERNEEEKKWERDREEKRKVKEKKETNAKEKRESDPLISNSFRKLQLPANRKRSVSRWDEILFQNEEKKEKKKKRSLRLVSTARRKLAYRQGKELENLRGQTRLRLREGELSPSEFLVCAIHPRNLMSKRRDSAARTWKLKYTL